MDPPFNLIDLVSRQLGRKPAIVFRVVLECPFGWPAVLLNQPFTLAGKPNPNLYYLSCPFLRRRLSQLEDSGFIAELEAIVRQDADIAEDLLKAQEKHRSEWLKAVDNARKQRLMESAAPDSAIRNIPAPNIAATREELKIKCLHAHTAWFLIHSEYRLGRLISEKIGELWCSRDICKELG